jgi:ubiquinone/menaquinone biosynthesis C-methylase UbiE
MAVHSPLSHLFPRSTHSPYTRGHTLGSPRAYDAFVDFFFLGRRRATFQSLVRTAGLQPGQRVLDVGCGTGYLAGLFAQAVGADGTVLGIDASLEMIEYAGRQRGGANCHFEVGTAEALSVQSDQFDVVVSSLFLHHLPADLRSTALAEMHRVLRPGGSLLIVEAQVPRARVPRLFARLHGFDRMAEAVSDLERLIANAGFAELLSGEVPPWLRYVRASKLVTGTGYSPPELNSVLERAGA